jgi:phosphatidylserine/phosphatidylglycerophosphate/cardiolipin synthase-like enzyme
MAMKAGVLVWGLVGLGAYGLWDQVSVALDPPREERRIDVLFSPDGGCTARIVKEIDKAKERVLVQIYFFTSKPIAKALTRARKRGVECQVIADKSQEKQTYGRLPVLRRDGVSILIDGEHATANNKIMLIDDTTIITGSFNYTRKAEDENAENILIIKGYRRLFDKYLANYQHHKEHTRKYKTS